MYLSRVAIDSRNRKKIRDLSHLGAYHNWVESCFEEEFKDNVRSRKLWRIDELNGQKYLLVVSEKKPDLEFLEKYGITGSAETKQYDHFLASIEQGKCYRFRVALNPVVSLSQGIGKRGRTVPLISAEQQLHYLESRAERAGFSLIPDEYQIMDRGWEELRKHGQKTIQLCRVTYEGVLKVTDKNAFYHTLTNGIGKKKAYGFGLLTVIPL